METIKILWRKAVEEGMIRATHGTIKEPQGPVSGTGVTIRFGETRTGPGPCSTLVHVEAGTPFSFFLRDISAEHPIYLPVCGAAVTTEDDPRGYDEIAAAATAAGGKTQMQQTAEQNEYDFERAAKETRDLPGPVWLGVSKDMRFFQVGMRSKASGNESQTYDEIYPLFIDQTHTPEQLPEFGGRQYALYMLTGRGIGCRHQITKALEDGYLPVLKTTDIDGDITYSGTCFATLEKSPLDTAHLRGSDMYVADSCGYGNMQTPAQRAKTDAAMKSELFREEETVLYIRIAARNTSKAPAYAYIKMPSPLQGGGYGVLAGESEAVAICPETGFLAFEKSRRVCVAGTLDGRPVNAVETAILIAPGKEAVFEFRIPHTPVGQERARDLLRFSFDERLSEAKRFWETELQGAAKICLPEKRIEHMIKAGLLHLDIGYFGENPDGPVVPSVGKYTAIGSESAPGIQFLDTVGMHDLAKRAIGYFVEKQHENGFMQNFGGYMLETGSVLWTMGEHWRMTRDQGWLRSVSGAIVKAADYLIGWREENMAGDLKSSGGYGMIKGKVADPEDHFHSFMLNAGACAGLRRAGEMLSGLLPEKARYYAGIAAEMRENIRESFTRSLALSPAVPLSDGTWTRSFALWPEYKGPLFLYAEGGEWFTHGAFVIRDVLGASYLILQGVIDPQEEAGREILTFCAEYLSLGNVAFSQPYYSPHPYGQLMRGEVKPFLQEFYCGFAGLADREVYSFWEHYFHASPQKLHEEAWFLMRCRWMLALEDYEKGALRLLPGVPRAWLAEGQTISFDGIKTCFGSVNFHAQCGENRIRVTLKIEGEDFPQARAILVRIPHPAHKTARETTAGVYDPATETVRLTGFSDSAEFEVIF